MVCEKMVGVGTDLVEIERIKKAVEKNSFLTRFFTENEIAYFKEKNMRAESIAGCFAAKEAVVKAIGTGFDKFTPECIEIYHLESGKPMVKLHGGAKEAAKNSNIATIHISISHTGQLAMAFAVAAQ